jgi:hypothetical protein
MFEGEEWRPIAELPHYMVSQHGRVRHVESETARKVYTNDRGFVCVLLYGRDSKTRYLRQVNVLVAEAFLYPARFANETAVWHIDGDLTNCHVDNLRWDTRSRVLEWNRMHRPGFEPVPTPRVKNNRTGQVYENAYECAMHEGRLESEIIVRVERQARHTEDDSARYRYLYRGQV